MSQIVLISHSSVTWPGARNLFTAQDGLLLCVTRNPLRDGAARLIEEGHSPATTLVIRDSHDAQPEIRSTIKEALKA